MSPSTSSSLTVMPQPGQCPIAGFRAWVGIGACMSAGDANVAISAWVNDFVSIGISPNPRRAPNVARRGPGRQPADEIDAG